MQLQAQLLLHLPQHILFRSASGLEERVGVHLAHKTSDEIEAGMVRGAAQQQTSAKHRADTRHSTVLQVRMQT